MVIIAEHITYLCLCAESGNISFHSIWITISRTQWEVTLIVDFSLCNKYSIFLFIQKPFHFSNVIFSLIQTLEKNVFYVSLQFFFAINGHNLSFPDETLPHFFDWFWRNSFCHFSLNYFYYFFIIRWMWHSDKREFDEYLE